VLDFGIVGNLSLSGEVVRATAGVAAPVVTFHAFSLSVVNAVVKQEYAESREVRKMPCFSVFAPVAQLDRATDF
jgi:hypothetical protein